MHRLSVINENAFILLRAWLSLAAEVDTVHPEYYLEAMSYTIVTCSLSSICAHATNIYRSSLYSFSLLSMCTKARCFIEYIFLGSSLREICCSVFSDGVSQIL